MNPPHKQEAVFVLGASGMLGSAITRTLCADRRYDVYGVVRCERKAAVLAELQGFPRIMGGFDACDPQTLLPIISQSVSPVVINCVGLVKQLAEGNSVLEATPVNTLLPHRLVEMVRETGGRVIHFSTDCVFSGDRGDYVEDDIPDARDVYGLTKYLGEVVGPGALTLRTSIIGHGLVPNASLIDWFLAQSGPVKGYRHAVFSGLPTVVLARMLRDLILPNGRLEGLYHVSANPIDKNSLLELVRAAYGVAIPISPSDQPVIDRSLNSRRFRTLTGWEPATWPELVATMYEDYVLSGRKRGI